jgi:primosomal protein N' (replication factor Y)
VLGPVPAPLEKRAGRFRQQLLLLAETRRPLHRSLGTLLNCLLEHPGVRRCRWHLDVDPIDLL